MSIWEDKKPVTADSYDLCSVEESIKKAEHFDCDVIRSDEYHLLLDLDSKEQQKHFDKMLKSGALQKFFPCKVVDFWQSKSGKGHKHVVLKLEKPLHPLQRLVLQAALGSDPNREILTLQRVLRGEEEPSLLYKPRKKWSLDD